jgi:hypothetical protein
LENLLETGRCYKQLKPPAYGVTKTFRSMNTNQCTRRERWFEQHSQRWLHFVLSAFKPKGFVHGVGLITLCLFAIFVIWFTFAAIAAAREGIFLSFLHGFYVWLNDMRI